MSEANIQRDAALRNAMLRALYAARATPGGMRGRTLRRVLDSIEGGDQFNGDEHCLLLAVDLAKAGYASVVDDRTKKNQPFTLDFVHLVITDKGVRFCEEASPADGLIDDGRIVRI